MKTNLENLKVNKIDTSSLCVGSIFDPPKEPPTTFTYYHLPTMEDVRNQIQECEGKHKQQVSYSTYHDALTQVCFTCRAIKSSMNT